MNWTSIYERIITVKINLSGHDVVIVLVGTYTPNDDATI